MTKVIYNTYSCGISGMSREMMKMNGRDSAECQNWEKKGHKRHFRKVFKSLNDKIVNSASSPSISKRKKRGKEI